MAPHMPIFTFVLKLHMYQLIYFCSFIHKTSVHIQEKSIYIYYYI